MEQELKTCDPNRMIFCSFTKKAVDEAVTRASERFGFSRTDMTYFKTIHALGFKILSCGKNSMMQTKDYKSIGEHLGLEFSSKFDFFFDDSLPGKKYAGDRYTFMYGFSKARKLTHEQVWERIPHDDLNWFEYKRFCKTIDEYKIKKNKKDFADLLIMKQDPLDVDIVIIDEAQDLSTAQWQFIMAISKNAKKIYIGGDDDQAIFSWSGADVNYFLNLPGEKTILTQSYRIPRNVHKVATRISKQIHNRIPKKYSPRDTPGQVDYWHSVDHVDLSSGTWLLLARNAHLLYELTSKVKEKGFNFTVKGQPAVDPLHLKAIKLWEAWRKGRILESDEIAAISKYLPSNLEKWPAHLIWHKAFVKISVELREFYISLLRRGESISSTPRIAINTIHGIKGGEADNVLLVTDLAYSTWEGLGNMPDAEHRVWYVGATRCKESLNIIMPRGKYHYNI